jgi:hypothetical protein
LAQGERCCVKCRVQTCGVCAEEKHLRTVHSLGV